MQSSDDASTIDTPLISALVSTYNAERFIQGALEDLVQQTIANRIEIIVIDSGSMQKEGSVVKRYQARYGNILYLRTERETVYQAWNRGIRIARGRYLTNANADDRHRVDALEVMAIELERNPDIALVYADSAVTFEENQTFDTALPKTYHLRPEYNPGIMLTGCHMGPQPMWRKSIHEDLGHFRDDLRSAGDYEFWCRLALRHNLKHIPQTLGLYYENPRGICNSDKALSAGEARVVMQRYQGLLPDPSSNPIARRPPRKGSAAFVNIGMVTFNRLEFTRQAIASVIKYADFPYVLTVVDNASRDGTREYLQQLHDQELIDNLLLLDENVGVAKASNLAWHREPEASHYLKLDNDIVIRKPGWLGRMVAVINQVARIGLIAYNFEPNSYPLVQMEGLLVRVKPSGNLGGACLLVPRRTWELLGDWCEDYGLYGEEDRDYGFRVSLAGLINAYMEDEDIGDHLPAGKAALISAATLVATDGQEERNETCYRQWKDAQRGEHLKPLGTWEQNQYTYANGLRPLRVESRFVAERGGAAGFSNQSGSGSRGGFVLLAGLTLKRLTVATKKLQRLLRAIQRTIGGSGMFVALGASLRAFRSGGLNALRTKALYFLNQTVNYGKWVALYDCLTDEDRRQIAERISTIPSHPAFSVLMPVYKPEVEHLEHAIESVRAQLYPHWELCVADDASDDARVTSLIDSYCQRDCRIKAMSRPERGHISAASNDCLDMATGEFIALLDHDDLLAPHALYMVAQALNHRPDLSLIYTDEDKINASGVCSWPHFKPDWNADLMRSQNAVNHLGIYRSSLVREVGGFRTGVEGCQDWDLALRVSERIDASQILHLPYVLYHWRITSHSTAVSTASKQYVTAAGKKVLEDHLKRMGVNAEVLSQYGTYFRIRYGLDRPLPVAVISRFAEQPALERLIHGLTKGTAYPDLVLVLTIDAEKRNQLEPIVSMAQAHNLKLILIDYKTCTNSAERINYAVSVTDQELICLLDPECVPSTPDWLRELVSHAVRPEIGVVGAKKISPDGTVCSAGMILGMGSARVAGAAYKGAPIGERGAGGRAALIQNFSAVDGSCMLFRRTVWQEANGFDPALPIEDYGNVDFCLRLGELGYRVVWTPFAELVWQGLERESAESIEAAKTMRSRWQKKLGCDPAHNPNLSLSDSLPMLAPAPRVPRCSAYRPESGGI